MSKELIIHSQNNQIDIALLENKVLVELNHESSTSAFSAGDIYLGRVRKLMSGLNAAFVNIGYERDAFIHYLDLGPSWLNLSKITKLTTRKTNHIDISYLKLLPELKKQGKIASALSSGDMIIVQISKEPISTKGPRLTADISIPGRHLVLIPLTNKIHISQKIKSNPERNRLKGIVENILPKNFGAIVRTAAEGKSQNDIENDIVDLLSKWDSTMKNMQSAEYNTPKLLMGEQNKTIKILRDLLNDSFNAVYIDNETLYNQVKEYISAIEPNAERIVKLYKGKVPIFDNFDVTKQIKQTFGRTVPFKQGAYLVVEHTEALHVIDVNSGKRSKSDENQEQNALEVNMNAIPEIARQLRLKDMGGIIVIDFIDLHDAKNRAMVLKNMQEAMRIDRAKHNILPLSKFGLMQITRQRVKPETKIKTSEVCPSCQGTGQVSPSILIDGKIESEIAYLVREKHYKLLTIHTHPYIASYLKKGLISMRTRLALKYKISLKIIPNESMSMIEYKIYNSIGEPIN